MTHKEILIDAFAWFTAAGCKTYGRPNSEIKSMITVYASLMADLSADTLKAACEQCAKTCPDWPTVADIRKAAAEIAEAKRAELRTAGERTYGQEECPWCGGSGWESYLNHHGITESTRCRCRKPGFILPPPKPRKLLTEAEKSEFAASLGMISGGKS